MWHGYFMLPSYSCFPYPDACSPFFLPGSFIENGCKSRRLSKMLIHGVSRLFLAFGQPADQYPSSRWILLKNHYESSSGTYNSVREGARCQYGFVCSVQYLFWKRLIQSQHLRQQAPKEPRGYFDPGPWENSRRDTQKRMQKRRHGSHVEVPKVTLELRQSLHQNPKTLGRASLAISSVLSTSTLVKAQKHLPFVCGAGNFIKSWLQLPKFLLFTLLETTCPKSA